jgi:hypothetical protein
MNIRNEIIKSDNYTELIISLILHGIIMFIILSGLFIFVISKMSKKTIQTEIDHIMKDTTINFINPILEKYNISINNDIKLKLIKVMNKEDNIQVLNNNYINGIIISIIIALIGIFIIIYLLLIHNNIKIDLLPIFIENIITFLFVGIIEGLFIYLIAIKYVPVMPSFITKAFLQQIKKNLNT